MSPSRTQVATRPMEQADGHAVLAIYAEGIAGPNATFETTAPEWDDWDRAHLAALRFVAVDPDAPERDIVGWAAASPVSERCVYAGVAEVSVYVAGRARGRGVGGALLGALVTASESSGVWTLQAGIFADNVASLALHARHGFRRVGVRERLGQRDGTWRDVVLLERRSAVAGI